MKLKRFEVPGVVVPMAIATAALARTQTAAGWFWFWSIICGAYLFAFIGLTMWNATVETINEGRGP